MSHNPFTADAALAARIAELELAIGPDLSAAIATLAPFSPARLADNTGGVIFRAEADALVARFGLHSIDELMRLLVPVARQAARPPISNFFVGAVGLEAETGNLILGGNIEFSRTTLSTTVHGETCLAMRAFSRGTSLSVIALGEAHPCAHCRQFLSEFIWSRSLTLIDRIGHTITLAQLYPWPFDPAYLGNEGAVPGRSDEGVALAPHGLDPGLAAALLAAGRRAHAPYSQCPGAVVLRLKGGGFVTGASVESVAFNPSMGPVSAAMIDLFAHGLDPRDIDDATLAVRNGGAVDHAASAYEQLAALRRGLPLTVVDWL
jgi:cytidine deaminase